MLEQTESRSRDWNLAKEAGIGNVLTAWTNRISLKRLKLSTKLSGETRSRLEQTESRSRDWNYSIFVTAQPSRKAWTNRISLKRLKLCLLAFLKRVAQAWTNRISLKRLKQNWEVRMPDAKQGLNKQNLAQEIETYKGVTRHDWWAWLEQTESRSRDWNLEALRGMEPPLPAWTNRISLKRLKPGRW